MADFRILIGGRCDRKWRFSKGKQLLEGTNILRLGGSCGPLTPPVVNIFESRNFHEFDRGRCDRKSRFSKGETAFAGVQKCLRQKMAIFKRGNSVCKGTKIFRSHIIYTKNSQFSSSDSAEIWFYLHRDGCAAAIRFYLHRDGCAAAIRVLSTQRSVRRGDLIVMDLYLHSFGGRCDEKWRFSNKETAFAG